MIYNRTAVKTLANKKLGELALLQHLPSVRLLEGHGTQCHYFPQHMEAVYQNNQISRDWNLDSPLYSESHMFERLLDIGVVREFSNSTQTNRN